MANTAGGPATKVSKDTAQSPSSLNSRGGGWGNGRGAAKSLDGSFPSPTPHQALPGCTISLIERKARVCRPPLVCAHADSLSFSAGSTLRKPLGGDSGGSWLFPTVTWSPSSRGLLWAGSKERSTGPGVQTGPVEVGGPSAGTGSEGSLGRCPLY